MSEPDVREIGRVETGDFAIVVGIHRGSVTLSLPGARGYLTPGQADELAANLITACWQAGLQGGAP